MKRRVAFALAFVAAFAACENASRQTEDANVDVQSEAEAPTTETAAAEQEELLNPNEASAEELTSIAGMDQNLADALVAGRPYDDMLAVDQVLSDGLDETEREAVYEQLWLPIDLNDVTDEEILLIPGVGDRMLEEFKEYRPYSGIEEFRREIGKYVDEEQVATWERYVTVASDGG